MARPIHTAPRNGKVILVGDDHGTIARAFWHVAAGHAVESGIWAYSRYSRNDTFQQIDFTPTRWGESTDEFERD